MKKMLIVIGGLGIALLWMTRQQDLPVASHPRADIQSAIKRGHKNRNSAPVNTFVNDCVYQTRRLAEARKRFDNGSRLSGSPSKTATTRLMVVIADKMKACNEYGEYK